MVLTFYFVLIFRRAIQHAEDDLPKVDGESLALIEDIYVGKLRAVLESLQSPEKRIHLPSQTQACLIFAISQTIPSLPTCKSRLGSDYCALLANLLVDNMLDLNKDGILPLGQILRVIGQDLFIYGSKGNHLPVEGEAYSLLTKTVRGPLFSEMGRIARTVATLLEGVEDWKEIESILLRMHSFAVNVHADWSRNRLSQADTFLVSEPGQEKEAGVMQLDQESTKAMAMLFQVFKTLIFAYTMIFGAVVEKSSTEPGKMERQKNKQNNRGANCWCKVLTFFLTFVLLYPLLSCSTSKISIKFELLDSGQLCLPILYNLQVGTRRIPSVRGTDYNCLDPDGRCRNTCRPSTQLFTSGQPPRPSQ